MGLRYRKSIKIAPGLKVNFGTTGMSLSAGVPGLRRTYHTSGRVTTSVGIPGTGLYYVDVKGPNQRNNNVDSYSQTLPHMYNPPNFEEINYDFEEQKDTVSGDSFQLSIDDISSIHKKSDDSIDWTELLANENPPDSSYNAEIWKTYHHIAPQILSGNIDAYLDLIYSVNPLNDISDYAGEFEFGTDNSRSIEVELIVNDSPLENLKTTLSAEKYNEVFQDYVCSICIRIARDLFALLPIKNTYVNAKYKDKLIVSVIFDRNQMSKIKFGFIDSSETLAQFKHNMRFDNASGFKSIETLLP